MRHLISAICAFGVLGAPASALAADKTADLRDARCIAAAGVMFDLKSTKKNDKAFLTTLMLYSLGRIEGRNESFDLPALMEEALVEEDENTLVARAMSCINSMTESMKVLQFDQAAE